jgi:hypothetical protein
VFICGHADLMSEISASRIRKVAAIKKSQRFSEAGFYANSLYVI